MNIMNQKRLVLEYYTTPANGISGIDAQTLFFEVYVQLAPLHNDGYSCKIHQMANTSCGEGPNSTILEPTTMVFLPYMGWVYQYSQIPDNWDNKKTLYWMKKTYEHFYGELVD